MRKVVDIHGNELDLDYSGTIVTELPPEQDARIQELERQVEVLKATVTQMLKTQGLSGEYLFDRMSLLQSLEK